MNENYVKGLYETTMNGNYEAKDCVKQTPAMSVSDSLKDITDALAKTIETLRWIQLALGLPELDYPQQGEDKSMVYAANWASVLANKVAVETLAMKKCISGER